MSDDLTTWLLAQLDAEAETARATTGGGTKWHAQGSELRTLPQGHAGERGVHPPYWRQIATGPRLDYVLPTEQEEHRHQDSRPDFAHFARQDPQATLDRIEAMRAVVAMHRPVERDLSRMDVCSTCADFDTDGEGEFAGRDEDWPCPTLRALAYAYRRQPGWREEWMPDRVEAAK